MRIPYVLLAIFACIGIVPAHAEVTNCQAITALPATVNAPGVWCLTGNLAWQERQGSAISVEADFVLIDLNGFLLENFGKRTRAIAIHGVERFNVTIRNGRIHGFYQGILLEGPVDETGGHLIERLQLTNSRHVGISVQGAGNVVRDNQVVNTNSGIGRATTGIVLQNTTGALVSGNLVNGIESSDVAVGIDVSNSAAAVIRDNSVQEANGGTSYAVRTIGGNAVVIDSNRLINTTVGNSGIWNDGAASLVCTNNIIGGFLTATSNCSYELGNIVVPAGP